MPHRVQWEPAFSVGHELVDAQHRALLAQCNALADLLASDTAEDGERRFDAGLDQLRAFAREHFEAEAALLAGGDCAELEDHRQECDEFDVLVDEIATTENFDRLELQRFLALWCLGHVMGSAAWQRAFFAGNGRPE